jgi:phosphoribosylamine-glycine ligase
MKVLVIGGGGREHALAWKLAQSPRVQLVYVAPGNGGTASDKRCCNVPYPSNETLAQFARDEAIAFAVVGPEAALASGVVDVFRARGLRIFGPTRAAAQIESSKDFAKALMRRHSIPTADYRTFNDASAARAYVTERGAPIVTPTVHAKVLRQIIMPAINGMAAEGNAFTGFLYAGLMIDQAGNVKTVEVNSRLGDPEAQVILPRLKSDLMPLIEAAIDGRLDQVEAEWDRATALGVVIAAAGYPNQPRKGDAITQLPDEREDCITFHAGTALEDDQLITSGGRVLCVTALGETVRAAQKRAYDAVDEVAFDGMQFRRDIGYRALGSCVENTR